MIYADNAATSKLDKDAFLAMKPFLLESYANASQPYSFARSVKKALKDARETIAACINATPDEIFFTSGGTESDNWAIKGISSIEQSKSTIIVSSIEHHAVLRSCEALINAGHSVFFSPVDQQGFVIEDTFRGILNNSPNLVSIMLANNEIGTVQAIKTLCSIAHERHALFHTDAVQAVGHIPVNVRDLGVDLLSASAHKFNGPKGIGFLYVRRGIKYPSFHSGGTQENGMRAGTENVASIIGMAEALRINCETMEQTANRLLAYEAELIQILRDASIDFRRNGGTNHIPGNLSLSFRKLDGEMLLHRLDLKGICVSTGAACDSNRTQISHVLTAINLPEEYARGTIRISLGKYNSKDDVVIIANELVKIVSESEHI